MDMNVKVSLDLSDRAHEVLMRLVGVMEGAQQIVSSVNKHQQHPGGIISDTAPETVVPKTGEVKAPSAKQPKPTKVTPVVDIKAKETPAPAVTADPPKEGALTYDIIRAKVVSLRDAGHKDATVNLMKSFGVEKLGNIPEDKFAEFYGALNQIK